jgi:hypothetical protein
MSTSLNLLDEPVWLTVKRELDHVWNKIVCTLRAPFDYIRHPPQQYSSLQTPSVMENPPFAELDLWGPFLFFILYCVLIARDDGAFTFAFSGGLFFAIACAITAQLVSQVDIVSLLQYLCILGYSLITIDLVIVAIKFMIMTKKFLRRLNQCLQLFPVFFIANVMDDVLHKFGIPIIILGSLWSIITAFALMIQTTTMMLTGTIYTSAHAFLEQRSRLLLLPIVTFYCFLASSFILSLDRDCFFLIYI